MDESLNQPSSVKDDCPMGCKLLLYGNKVSHVWLFVCTIRIKRALDGVTTPDCTRTSCVGCGVCPTLGVANVIQEARA